MRTWLLIAAFAVFSGAASAQTAAATAHELLESQKVGDIFHAVADAPQLVVRHDASRMVCRFEPNIIVRIVVYEQSGLPRGDDVSCGQNRGPDVITLYATRYAQAMTPQQAIDESVHEITGVNPQARPTDPGLTLNPMAPFASETRAFVIPNAFHTNITMFSRTSVAVIDGWVYLMRFSSPADDPLASQRAEAAWRKFADDLANGPS